MESYVKARDDDSGGELQRHGECDVNDWPDTRVPASNSDLRISKD